MWCTHQETFGNCRFHVFESDFNYPRHPVYCQHGNIEIDCKYCTTSVAWAIVKDGKGMKKEHHDAALSWARGTLGLGDREEVSATRAPHDPEHDINED
jgi:hypothetical protein